MMDQKHFFCLVVGSRTFINYEKLSSTLDKLLVNQHDKIIHIVSGGAEGADRLAEQYADERRYVKHIFPADWKNFGKAAGFRRNVMMHQFIHNYENRGCVAFWDGQSKGTQHSFTLCERYGTSLRVIRI